MEILPEVEVWYALPAIRRNLAVSLKKQGLSQRSIADRLGLAESAVSQYLSGKRGGSELPENLDAEFSAAAERIAAGDRDVMVKEVLRLSELLKSTRVICDVHRQHDADLPAKCTRCFD